MFVIFQRPLSQNLIKDEAYYYMSNIQGYTSTLEEIFIWSFKHGYTTGLPTFLWH